MARDLEVPKGSSSAIGVALEPRRPLRGGSLAEPVRAWRLPQIESPVVVLSSRPLGFGAFERSNPSPTGGTAAQEGPLGESRHAGEEAVVLLPAQIQEPLVELVG